MYLQSQLSTVKKKFILNSLEINALKIIFGSLLISILAQVSIPMIPVPITGQTLAVTVVGFSLGRKIGVSAVALYLFEGIAGLPVFANGSFGFSVLTGPSGGYLLGFVFSTWILGYFSDKGVLNNFWKTIAVAGVASAVTFLFGLIQLSFFVPKDLVLQYGLIPFIPGGIIKAIIASLIVVPTYKFFKKVDENIDN